ncbi:MAG: hypothetical protein AB1726_14345 [Planctomycetota bacterium]
MSCQFCHVPFLREDASLSVDNATTGSMIDYSTTKFLSTDPLDPTSGTTDWWYPSATVREDSDGVARLFPDKLLLSTWWGDWVDPTADGPSADDTLSAMYLWKVRGIIGSAGLVATDDDGDGIAEVNTRAEILAYLTAIQGGTDVHGNPLVAGAAVLVKGGHAYYLDAGDPSGVGSFEIEGSGVKTESYHPFSIDHNVLPLDQGVTLGRTGCAECHFAFTGGADTVVFDRWILRDAFDETAESAPGAGDGAQPVYEPLRDVTGVDPF